MKWFQSLRRRSQRHRQRTARFTLSLQGIIAQGLSLNEVDFSLADLSEADLRDTYIRSSKFWRAYLWEADFRGATAQWSNFEGSIARKLSV